MNLKDKKGIIFLIILALGLFLRVYGLGSENIWFDEAGSAYYAKQNTGQLIEAVSKIDCTPPLYYVILHYWTGMFGDSEFSLRFPSVLFSLFSIYILYKIGILLFNKNVGLLSSLIISISGFHIYYAQEARSYSLLVLLTLLSFYFFIKMLKNKNSSFSICYAATSILLLYTHIYGVFILIAQNVYIFTVFLISPKSSKLKINKWILLQSILFISYIPWIFLGLIKQVSTVNHFHWYDAPGILQIYVSFVQYSGPSRISFLFFFVFSVIAIASIKRRKDSNIGFESFLFSFSKFKHELDLTNLNKIYFLFVWLFTPIILPFVISILITPIYVIRHTIVASLAFFLISAKGIDYTIKKYDKFKWIKFLIIGILIIFSTRSILKNYETINHEKWKEAVNYIDSKAKPGDLIVFYPGDRFILFTFNYYSNRKDLLVKPFLEDTTVNKKNIRRLLKFTKVYKRVWVVQRLKDPKKIIKNNLCIIRNVIYHKIYSSKHFGSGNKAIEIYLFKKNLQHRKKFKKERYLNISGK